MSPRASRSCAACVSFPAWASATTRSSVGIALLMNADASGLSVLADCWLPDLASASTPAPAATHTIRMTGTTRLRHEKPFFSGGAPASAASGAGISGRPVGAPQNGHVAR